MVVREAKVEEELYHLLKTALAGRKSLIEGVRFGDVEPQLKADGGRADLVVDLDTGQHLVVIECKRKVDGGAGKVFRQFDPLGSRVIDQALNYAVRLGAPLFATTNGRTMALFEVPERGQPFRIDRHRIVIRDPFPMTEDGVLEILTVIAKYRTGAQITRTPLDWTFISRLRSFVDWLTPWLERTITQKLNSNQTFRERVERFNLPESARTPETLGRETSYLLMNKIVFHRILERHYASLQRIGKLPTNHAGQFMLKLTSHFTEARKVTHDLEPIFSTGLFDEIPLPNNSYVLDEILAFTEEMEKYRLEEIGSDVIGFVYQELIPAQERHGLGQFYTPPNIAELITRWAIRTKDDLVLDPASGSGTFPVKAYHQLQVLSKGKIDHATIIDQLYTIDINPFPAHLTAMNIAIRDVLSPVTEMNILVEDFFRVTPNQSVWTPFSVQTMDGERRRQFAVPKVDALVANPPYTRWTELSEESRDAIRDSIGSTLNKYGLHAGGVKSEPMLYMHFIVHGLDFLREKGRLGMIISNSWLQANYGVPFGKYLMDKFNVVAILDFAPRMFDVPLVATMVVLLEKAAGKGDLRRPDCRFAYVQSPTTVDALLDFVQGNVEELPGTFTNIIPASELVGDDKWLPALFGVQRTTHELLQLSVVVPSTTFFDIARGNTDWAFWALENGSRVDLGANEFFILNQPSVDNWGIQTFVRKMLSSSRYLKHFSFTMDDWEELRRQEKDCYLFLCHKARVDLSGLSCKQYIEWGEKSCRTRADKPCNKSDSCVTRFGNPKVFRGWYDLKGLKQTCLFVPYYAQYQHRFAAAFQGLALDPDFIVFCTKKGVTLNETETKAILAFYNSSFTRLHLESYGRSTAGGMLSLEVGEAENLPTLGVKSLDETSLSKLATLFDNLEKAARRIGGANTRDRIPLLQDEIDDIDNFLSVLLGIDSAKLKKIKQAANLLRERRLARILEPDSSVVGSSEGKSTAGLKHRKRRRKADSVGPTTTTISDFQ